MIKDTIKIMEVETSKPAKKRVLKIKKETYLEDSTQKKTKLKIKRKKKIEKKLNSKFKPIEQAYLEFDTEIDPKFMSSIDTTNTKINMSLINNLPKFEFKTTICNEEEDDEESINHIEENEELDIDKDNLEPLTIGGKYYLIDYDKGIIYDQKYNSIGFIDEFGNPSVQ